MTDVSVRRRVLDVRGLTIVNASGATLVDDVSLSVGVGECLGLVGESGSGKSLTLRAALNLLPPQLIRSAGEISMADASGELIRRQRDLPGGGISMVFQEPMRSLNPTMRVGDLVAEGARASGQTRVQAARTALSLLEEVGFPDPALRLQALPHELSGGLRQRVMIAMALSVEPRVLLCDEPTTALDATIQDQILALLERLRHDRGLAMVFVSHDLGVIARVADRTAVMYAGSIVEEADTEVVISRPRHPYTRALIESTPSAYTRATRLPIIPGSPPMTGAWPLGCRFAPRCAFAEDVCCSKRPPLDTVVAGHWSACLRDAEINGGGR